MEQLTKRVGLAYLLSNLGSILAAIWILPSLGTMRGTILLAATNVALGLIVLFRKTDSRTRLLATAFAGLALVIAIFLPTRIGFGS